MMLCMSAHKEWLGIAVLVIGCQLKRIQIRSCQDHLVALQVIVVRCFHMCRTEKTTGCNPVPEISTQFHVQVIADAHPPFVKFSISAECTFQCAHITKNEDGIF